MAEIPTFQAMPGIDADGDGTAVGRRSWLRGPPRRAAGLAAAARRSRSTARRSRCSARRPPLSSSPGRAACRPSGSRGRSPASAPAARRARVPRRATSPGGSAGTEVTAVGAEGAALERIDRPRRRASATSSAYPQDLLSSPLDVTSMERVRRARGERPGPRPHHVRTPRRRCSARPSARRGGGPFAGVLDATGFRWCSCSASRRGRRSARWHALLPGHGKTLMAAYMVGSNSRVRQAVTVGTAVAVMHTASVLALGLLVLTLEQTFRPEALYPWLGLALGAGGARARRLPADLAPLGVGRCGATQSRSQRPRCHEHDLARTTRTRPRAGPAHPCASRAARRSRPRGSLALALAGGILPAPSALLVMLGADRGAPGRLRHGAGARVQRRAGGGARRGGHGRDEGPRGGGAPALVDGWGGWCRCCRRRRSWRWGSSSPCAASRRSEERSRSARPPARRRRSRRGDGLGSGGLLRDPERVVAAGVEAAPEVHVARRPGRTRPTKVGVVPDTSQTR